MYYGAYKTIRNSAWKCLADFHIDTLPVDVLHIARRSNIRVIRNSDAHILSPKEHGKTYFDGETWIIVYEDQNPTVLSRLVIAHELGHYFLGHELIHGKYPQSQEFKKKPISEQQAEYFALRLLCPACVLWGLDLHTADEIAQYCRVPENIAKLRAGRMKTLYERNKFLTAKIEQEIYQNFFPYILKKQKATLSDGIKIS